MFYVLLYVTLCPFKFCSHLDGEERELVVLLGLSSWCLLVVMWLFLAVPWVCLQFVIVVFPDHTHLRFLITFKSHSKARFQLWFVTSFSNIIIIIIWYMPTVQLA